MNIIHVLKDVVATWVLFELCGAVGAVAGFTFPQVFIKPALDTKAFSAIVEPKDEPVVMLGTSFGSRGVVVVSQYGWLIRFVYFSLW